MRGGSFNNNRNNARCAYRNNRNPNNRNNNQGVRVVVVGGGPYFLWERRFRIGVARRKCWAGKGNPRGFAPTFPTEA